MKTAKVFLLENFTVASYTVLFCNDTYTLGLVVLPSCQNGMAMKNTSVPLNTLTLYITLVYINDLKPTLCAFQITSVYLYT